MKSVRILVLLCAWVVTASAQGQTRRLYVTALDAAGTPVEGLVPGDFNVKEGGKVRDVVRVEPAGAKMQIAILVDDNGSGMFRVAVARFIESLLSRAEFAISTVTGQSLKLLDYTSDPRELSSTIQRLGVRPATNGGNQLLDGITGAARELAKRKAGRPIILALTVGGDDVTPMQPEDAFDELRRSGAQLYVVEVLGSAIRRTTTPTKPGDLLDEGHALQAVLGDGPKRSGGNREEVSALAGVDTGLVRLATQLKGQYLIEYSLEGSKPSDRVSITLTRKDVTLRAPTHVPNKI
jgi:VWFA-related protein